jgi:hypothetical protein
VGVVPLEAPPIMVREAASIAGWATPPEVIVTSVWAAANTLVQAGWPQVVAGAGLTPMPPPSGPSAPTTRHR